MRLGKLAAADALVLDAIKRSGSGFATWSDSTNEVEGSAQAIAANTRTLLSIDGLGAQTELRWMDRLLAGTWASNAHTIIEVGQSFDINVEFGVKKTAVATDAIITLTHDIGSDPLDTDSVVIFSHSMLLTKAQNVEHGFTKSWSAYGKETYFANKGRFYIECNEAISIWRKEIHIKDTGTPRLAS